MTPSEGIDERSSAEDVADALARLNADLKLQEDGDGWRATVTAAAGPADDGAVTGTGASRDEAAHDAWNRFRSAQGGTGTS